MICPNCKAPQSSKNDRVIETRKTPGGLSLRRRRECGRCGYRFSTREIPVDIAKKHERLDELMFKGQVSDLIGFAIEDLKMAKQNVKQAEQAIKQYLKCFD